MIGACYCAGRECGDDGCDPTWSCGEAGRCVAYGAGNTCDAPFVITDLPYESRSSTVFMTDHYSFGDLDCPGEPDGGGAGASEHVYRFTAPVDGLYTARLRDEIGYDMNLYLASSCADIAGTCEGASNTPCVSWGSCTETVKKIMRAGETWYYFADGSAAGEEGSYSFSLELTCEPDCAGRECGFDPCTFSCGSCADGSTCGPTGQCVP